MKLLVTGAGGQLGHDVMLEIEKRGHVGVASTVDITDENAIKSFIINERPDACLHCAAWTAVDAAEEPDNIKRVYEINECGTRYIAEACRDTGSKIIYISTDYVFDGTGNKPWDPDCRDYAPLNIYGKSKLNGELAVSSITDHFFIVRTAWVFGKNGNNFVKTMIGAGRKHSEVSVVNDQIGTPTYTVDLARLLIDMCESERYGYYHATNEGGYISWYEFCVEFYRRMGLKTKVRPVSTAEYGLSKAVRPFNSRLDKGKLIREGFTPLPGWQDALARYLEEAEIQEG